MSNNNPWKYVSVDDVDVETNPYLNPPAKPAPAPHTLSIGDSIVLENIACYDVNGSISEQYPKLAVQKDIFRNSQRGQINFTPYNAVTHCEKNGLFLPSFALTCNILVALYQAAVRKEANGTYTTLDAEVKKVLDQYKNHGEGFGYHAQNTIIDYSTQAVIHYPTAADFAQTTAVNAHQQRIPKQFVKSALEDSLVENVLSIPSHNLYIRQLTGLADPKDLVVVGEYFGKPAKLWFPWNGQAGTGFNEKRAAWFGCNSSYLNLFGNYILNNYDAARGVRRSAL